MELFRYDVHISLKTFFLGYLVWEITLKLWQPTVEGLQQGYCVIPSEKRFLVLYTFLRLKAREAQTAKAALRGEVGEEQKKVKIMVFFSSCSSVKFHAELLNFLGIECYEIHGQLKQQKRTSTFFRFLKERSGILLCTNVAARGLDIPEVVSFWPVVFKPFIPLLIFPY
jgi:ATP-dependent RNA helicase DDX18/HAS1